MSANTSPIFPGTPRTAWVQTSTSAVTSLDGTDANVKSVFTAGTNGSRIESVSINASATSALTTIRFWVNNGSTAGTAANNSLIHEEVLAAQTVTTTTATTAIVWPAKLILPANYKLLVAAAVATTAMNITALGGDY